MTRPLNSQKTVKTYEALLKKASKKYPLSYGGYVSKGRLVDPFENLLQDLPKGKDWKKQAEEKKLIYLKNDKL